MAALKRSLEKGGKPADLPLDRVDGVRLANPVKPGGGAWCWVNGSAVAVSEITVTDSGSCTLRARLPGTSAQPSVNMDGASLDGVCFDAAQLRSLASLPLEPVTSAGGGRWSQPPIITAPGAPLGASDIELPGPVRVEWTLPPGVTRLAATLELPPSARLWGDCEVVIEGVSTAGAAATLARVPLNQSTPTATVNTPLSGAARLRFTIDPLASGPIQDRVIIRRGLLLVQP